MGHKNIADWISHFVFQGMTQMIAMLEEEKPLVQGLEGEKLQDLICEPGKLGYDIT